MATIAAESTGGRWHATCLLVPPRHTDSALSAGVEQLVTSLARRGLTINRCENCFDAMADLVLHERGLRAGRSREPLVVIFIEPKDQPAAAAIADAALKHGSSTVYWEFQGGPPLRLTAFRPQPKRAIELELSLTPPPTPIVARGVAAPRQPERQPLRIVHDTEIEPLPLRIVSAPADAAVHAARPQAAALLTDEELSMLLGEGPEDGFSGGTSA